MSLAQRPQRRPDQPRPIQWPYFNMLLAVLTVSAVLSSFFLSSCSPTQHPSPSKFPSLIDVDLEQLQYGLDRHMFTSGDLVKTYVERIKDVNDTLHAVTEVNPDAVAIARRLDKERAAGHLRGPLHGIPIIIKNNIATHDRMDNTAGSYALLGAKVPRDSTMAARLRKAGAIILGKANLSQWANYRSNVSDSGWSANGGQTYGPYYPKQDPSGSSSGSAVAATLGLSLAALGTETDGSIVSPSENNNVVGIKPSVGLTSRYLVIPISETQDTVGPIARSVKDAAYLLQAIAGRDPRDKYTLDIPNGGKLPDYVAACTPNSLRGKRFGVPQNVLDAAGDSIDDAIYDAFQTSLATIEKAGGIVVNTTFTAYDEFQKSSNETIVLDTEFITGLATYFSELSYNPSKVGSLEELRSFTTSTVQEEFPFRDVGIWDGALARGYNSTDPRHDEAVRADQYLGGPGGVLGALDRDGLDAVLLPTVLSSSFAAIVGSPIVTVPMGFFPKDQAVQMNQRGDLVDLGPNIPFGLSFLGRRFGEAPLISYAYAYEQKTKTREQVQPYIKPSAELAASQ